MNKRTNTNEYITVVMVLASMIMSLLLLMQCI